MRKQISKYIKVLLGIALLVFIIVKVDFSSVVSSIKKAGYCYLLAGSLIYLVHRIGIDSFRFYYLVKHYFKSFGEILKVFFIGIFLNNVLIGSISADAYKIYYINKKIKNIGKSASYIFIEKFTLLLTSIIFLIIYFMVNIGRIKNLIAANDINIYFKQPKTIYILITIGLVAIIAIVLLLAKKYIKSVLSKIKAYWDQFLLTIKETKNIYYIVSFITAALTYGLKTFAFYYLLIAFGEKILWIDLLMIICAMRFLTYIPIGMGKIGIMEGYVVGALSIFGVGAAEGLAIALIVRGLQYLLVITGGVFSLAKR